MLRRYNTVPTIFAMISFTVFVLISPVVTLVSSWMSSSSSAMVIQPTYISKNTKRTTTSSMSWSRVSSSRRRSIDNNDMDEFASFAATLDDDDDVVVDVTDRVTSTTNTPKKKKMRVAATTSSSSSSSSSSNNKWQKNLDTLIFDRTTTIAQRQILISDLFNANSEIRESLTTALRDRTVRSCSIQYRYMWWLRLIFVSISFFLSFIHCIFYIIVKQTSD